MRKFEDREWMSVDDLAEVMGIGKTSAYAFIREAPFSVVMCGAKGKLIRIPVKAYYEWYDSLLAGAGLLAATQAAVQQAETTV